MQLIKITSIFATLLLATNIKQSNEAKVLAIFPVHSKSHLAVDKAAVKELANRGHDVTVVSPFPEEKPLKNYKDIVLKPFNEEEFFNSTGIKFDPFEMKDVNFFQTLMMLYSMGNIFCDKILQEESMQNLIKSNTQFDLIFLEAFFIDCYLGFAHKFKAPVIQVASFGGTEDIADLVGNPTPYAYIPDTFHNFGYSMNFCERLVNTLAYITQKLARAYFIGQQDAIMRKHFNDPNMPSIQELRKSTALVIVNEHFSISSSRPLVPNYVHVGGMHVKAPKKLPADLQKYLDDARDGVIYFSMGSNLKSSKMPKKTVESLIKAFSKLKQRVLWKWEEDTLPGQPENLKIGKWLPQSDILAHPNVNVFMTHGGLLSTQETINRGVPVIGIPIYGDQRLNMARIESMGFGRTLEFTNISEESVIWTIKEVVENPKYRDNAQRISRIYNDQSLKPLDLAVFWSEYVIRHKGAPHLRSAALDLTWYQYFLLDVIAVLVLVILSVLFILFYILRTICRLCFGSSKSSSTRKNQVSAKKKKN